MPAPTGTKRVRGVQVYRPFIYGTEAVPFDPENRPKDAPADHTHRWKVFVRGVNGEDISYWLRKVQFKLHDTYANSVRMIESPPFEVEETGWGEFEIAIKFYFVPESMEKPQQIWHGLKLHPYHGDIEQQKRDRSMISSVCYEEVLFNEPVEAFYDILTGGTQGTKSKSGKGSKGTIKAPPTAEIPLKSTPGNKFSREEENKELDRLTEAVKTVQKLIAEEKTKLVEQEAKLQELEKTEGKPVKKK
ncbi:Protein AF-9-like protein [Exophiala dermatitidis]|uniref:Protein AF-9 homolog n=1 Tax=Exophiala dermatitidis (strain ATCC 34100 / CBS 525.76 / NIH/UT8656) TaxID=858893 RepID=H6C226_EXODN|nr:YEATS domain-containing protein 4 [Exophiala dermatitidis NIH/UT8656]EHY57851.1 YEATS domain-containing protein 4 [Exophiala dermatitidis NIH/UT8656]